MYSIYKCMGRMGNLGRPLPHPYPVFKRNKVTFRYGATSMIAGRPGSYKSLTALNMMVYWASQGLSALYFSADSDEATVAKRLSGILTGDSPELVEHKFDSPTPDVETYFRRMQDTIRHCRFEYQQMDMDHIASRAATFEAPYGRYPDIVFIDNLINFVERPDDYGDMLWLTKELDGLARECKMHVCVLHHAKLDKNKNPAEPPADWEIQGKITQIPRLVLTTGASGNRITMACVKNSGGPQNPMADQFGWFNFNVGPDLSVNDVSARQETYNAQLVNGLMGV